MQAKTSTHSNSVLKRAVPLWILLLLFIVWGLAIFYLFWVKPLKFNSTAHSAGNNNSPQKTNTEFPLLSPDAGNGNQEFVKPFRHYVADYVDKCVKEGKAKSVSVYFRALNDGYMFGINEHENYRPASLLKVPVMIAYLKMAQDSPQILDKQMLFGKRLEGPPNNVPNHIVLGNYYTIRQLIRQMIVYSDNDASSLLDDNLNKDFEKSVFRDFGIAIPDKEQAWDDYLSLSDYTRFFRVLYNASYLNREMSEFALNILSESYFKDGIVLGVGDTKVAHKYGEWYYDGLHQLHDCGIVYLGNRPYILGVMTKGKDIYTLAGVIQGVSNIVYNNLQKGI